MASLTSIRNGIGTNLGNISSLIVYNYVPDSIEPPTAVVGVVQSIEYDTSMARGADTYTIPIFLYYTFFICARKCYGMCTMFYFFILI